MVENWMEKSYYNIRNPTNAKPNLYIQIPETPATQN